MPKKEATAPDEIYPFERYELVWAKHRKYPWWPAKILNTNIQDHEGITVMFVPTEKIYTIPRSHVEKYSSSKHRVGRKSGKNQKLIEAQELFDSIERDLKIDNTAIQVSLRDLSDLNQAVPDQPINEPSQLNLFLSPSTEKKHFETQIFEEDKRSEEVKKDQLSSSRDQPFFSQLLQETGNFYQGTSQGKQKFFVKKFYKILKRKGISSENAKKISVKMAHFNNNGDGAKKTFQKFCQWISSHSIEEILTSYQVKF